MVRKRLSGRAVACLLAVIGIASAIWLVGRSAREGAGSPAGAVASTMVPAVKASPLQSSVTVIARKYVFDPARIEVDEGDVVTITLQADDIPHSFTIDAYRIAKRAAPGQPATFTFRADQPGTFPFYCSLAIDEGCRRMRGELSVRPRR